MDQMELRSGKTMVKGDQRWESDDDLEEDVGSLMEAGYAMGGEVEEELIPPRWIDHVENRRPPLPAIDISSVRVPPASVTTLLELTSTRGLPKPMMESQRTAKFYRPTFNAPHNSHEKIPIKRFNFG